MNVKHLAKFAGSALGAGAALRSFTKARRENDRLRMLDAIVSVVSVAVAVAIVIREIRDDHGGTSRLVDLEDNS